MYFWGYCNNPELKVQVIFLNCLTYFLRIKLPGVIYSNNKCQVCWLRMVDEKLIIKNEWQFLAIAHMSYLDCCTKHHWPQSPCGAGTMENYHWLPAACIRFSIPMVWFNGWIQFIGWQDTGSFGRRFIERCKRGGDLWTWCWELLWGLELSRARRKTRTHCLKECIRQ